MDISIITPTIRKDGLDVVRKAVSKQKFDGTFEWLIGSPFDPEIPEATWVKDDFEGGYWSLNRIYNKLFRQAQGELFVTWQDWIYAPPTGLAQFWHSYKQTDSIVSGVGDQYESVNKWGKPEVKIWSDPRKAFKHPSGSTFYEIFSNDCEWNWAAIPRIYIYEVGGMDETLDFLGFGGDQLQICERMDAMGYKFYIDQTNESFTIRHGRESYGGEDRWNGKHVLFSITDSGLTVYDERRLILQAAGMWPKLDYLR